MDLSCQLQDSAYLLREAPFAYGEIVMASVYEDMLSVPRMQGLENTMMKLLNGQCSNVYHPASIIGMNAASENHHAAKQFVEMMLWQRCPEANAVWAACQQECASRAVCLRGK